MHTLCIFCTVQHGSKTVGTKYHINPGRISTVLINVFDTFLHILILLITIGLSLYQFFFCLLNLTCLCLNIRLFHSDILLFCCYVILCLGYTVFRTRNIFFCGIDLNHQIYHLSIHGVDLRLYLHLFAGQLINLIIGCV